MSKEHGIDGDEPLFHFDHLEGLENDDILEQHLDSSSRLISVPADLLDMSYIPDFSSLDLSAYTTESTPAEVVRSISMAQASDDTGAYQSVDDESMSFKGKGKAVSQPMNIQLRDPAEPDFDLFSLSSPASGSSRGRRAIPVPSSSASTAQTSTSFAFSPTTTPSFFYGSYDTNVTTPGSSYSSDDAMKDMSMNGEETTEAVDQRQTKGKVRAEPPVLPPLTFSPSEFTHGETNWPLGPHAPTIANAPNNTPTDSVVHVFPFAQSPSVEQQDNTDSTSSSFVPRQPARTRSFSSLSTKSAKSLAARSVAKLTLSLSGNKRSSNLARKLLLGKNNDIIYIRPGLDTGKITDPKLQSSLSEPCSPYLTGGQLSFFGDDIFIDSHTRSLQAKTAPRNLFDTMLPRETRLTIFMTFLALHEKEGETLRRGQSWTALTASKPENRWIGKSRGFIELVRLSSVSKGWQSLVFDGQIWVNLDIREFITVPSPLLQRLAASSGSFVRNIDFSGHTRLSGSTLIDISKSMCIYNSNSIYDSISSTTQLTHVNVSGCSTISFSSLQHLLKHSPWLVSLKAKGINAVTNDTCRTLAHYCPRLEALDFNRCHRIDCDGISALMSIHQTQHTQSHIRELRISGLRRVNDSLLSLLGRYAPNLEVLDLCDVRGLHNTALEAFVTAREDELDSDVLILTSREAGRDPGDATKYRRRVTKLRHLSLSSCPLLTDKALSHLAHAVPKLEYLELASIGPELRDEGLIHLLRTTPLLRRLDLEDACDITDAVLAAITPEVIQDNSVSTGTPQPGSLLQQLILSYAVQISNGAMMELIHACTHLKYLEVDNTRVSSAVVKEFIRLCRKRQTEDAGIVAVDCRGVGESTIKDLADITRTRKGWRSWDARALQYLDGRDNEDLDVGQDECDDKRVVLKSFYTWQTVDAVTAARQKRKKAERKNGQDGEDSSRRGAKWWTPGGRRVYGTTPPASPGFDRDRESCIIM